MWMGGTIKSERSLINNDLIPWGNYPVNELHSGAQEAAPFWIPVAHDLSVSLSCKHVLKNLTAKYGTSKVKIIQIIKNDVIVFVVHSFLMIKSMLLAVFGIFFFLPTIPAIGALECHGRHHGLKRPPSCGKVLSRFTIQSSSCSKWEIYTFNSVQLLKTHVTIIARASCARYKLWIQSAWY
mgnify:CR=1 FL=1